jgi:hypothetical protein
VRQLNRVEYRNTLRDLLSVDFDTEKEFPPDDAGHGFDNIGDVLTLPPMLLEKYLAAAKTIVTRAVPAVPRAPAEKVIAGRNFSGELGTISRTNRNSTATNALVLSYYERSIRGTGSLSVQLSKDFSDGEPDPSALLLHKVTIRGTGSHLNIVLLRKLFSSALRTPLFRANATA